MWRIVSAPTVDQAKSDLDELKKYTRTLTDADINNLKNLYEDFHDKKGEITKINIPVLDKGKNDYLVNQYNKEVKCGGKLKMINDDLLKEVELHHGNRCPICSINEPRTLDHHSPKSAYPQLALCRLNLVPTCYDCNHDKEDDVKNQYVHSYYTDIPDGVTFFIINCYVVNDVVVVDFDIDGTHLNPEVKNVLLSQLKLKNLQNRWRKAINTFITELIIDYDPNALPLDVYLSSEQNKAIKKYGLNDWRSAIITGLMKCGQFDNKVVAVYKKRQNNNI